MPKKKRSPAARNNLHRRYIPVELVEKIALHLPVKSLLRFSTVSRSWNSTILAPGFAKRYRGGEMIVLRTAADESLVCPLSSLSSHNPTDNAVPFSRPLNSYVLASCGELWCVEIEKNSLYLYNPSIRTRRRLPNPSAMGCSAMGSLMSVFVYGLGYDVVGDDYKLLRLHRNVGSMEKEVYSLVSNCWREVSMSKFWSRSPTPAGVDILSPEGVFVSGALHWLIHHCWIDGDSVLHDGRAILSVDVSSSMEEFHVVELPWPLPVLSPARFRQMDVTVLRGMLGVCCNCEYRFVAWVMKEPGSWTKELDINYAHIHPICFSYYLKPLFFYHHTSGDLIKAVTTSTDVRNIFIIPTPSPSTPSPSLLEKKSFGCGVLDHFTYLESFVKL